MLSLALCDDENYILNDLKVKICGYLKKNEIDAQISCFASGISLLCAGAHFDVIIMDIKMDGLNGMDTIRRLRAKGDPCQVIFVTSSREHVFQAFDVDAVHYLMKPVTDEDLFRALYKALRHCEQVDRKSITITKGSSVLVIPIRDIVYCEAIDHKIYLCMMDKKVDYYSKLDILQEQVDDRFFRCHRSYLVNMNFVSAKVKDGIMMMNGDKILVSRRKQQLFSQQLLSFIRSEVL